MLSGLFAATVVLASAPSANPLKTVEWANAVVPASACGGQGSVRLVDSYGLVSSSRWRDAWNSNQPAVMADQVEVAFHGPVRYGTVMADRRPEALVPIWCTNAGGTAGGQLGQSIVVFHGARDGLAVTGIITLSKANDTMAYFDNSATRIETGTITLRELFYGPNDSACCPTGRAENTWTLNGTNLVRSESHVTQNPKP